MSIQVICNGKITRSKLEIICLCYKQAEQIMDILLTDVLCKDNKIFLLLPCIRAKCNLCSMVKVNISSHISKGRENYITPQISLKKLLKLNQKNTTFYPVKNDT